MPRYTTTATALIPASAERVYAILADYRNSHPCILPKPYFISLDVERGGFGADTVIRFQMRLLGRRQSFRACISEPEPGRVITETSDSGEVTTFTVDPHDQQSAQVTIATTTIIRAGVAGTIKGWFTTRLLRPIYVKELAQLAAFAKQTAL